MSNPDDRPQVRTEIRDEYLLKENEELRKTVTEWQVVALFLGLILFLILLAHFTHGTADEPPMFP